MNNDRGKRVVNFSQSRHNLSESTPPLQIHNFMPMPSSSAQDGQDLSEPEKHADFMDQLKQSMQSFWTERLSEIHEPSSTDIRAPHALPLARIKKVMKSDEKVKMISADTPVLFAKACELFVLELTARAWMHTSENSRRTMQRNDVAYAIRDESLLAFLNDMVPLESHQDNQVVDLAIPSNDGVYVPLPHGINTEPEEEEEAETEAARGRPVASDDHHSALPMSLHDYLNPALFTGSGEMQQNPSFPLPSPSDAGNNAYLIFKEFFP